MKFEDFKYYKEIVESTNTELLVEPEAHRVYQWMEETGRIDEGFWSSIWSWLKKNFSPTSRKIHALAEEYEKELTAEYRAEYGKLRYKDLDSKFRRSWAGRIAEDIEDKMNLVAGDDEVYRELVKNLVNKKKLKVKKTILKEVAGKLDPEYADDPEGVISSLDSHFDREEKKVSASYKRTLEKTMTGNPETFKKASEILRKKISGDSKFKDMGYDNTSRIQDIVQKLIVYQDNLSQKGEVDFSVKAIEKTLTKFANFVLEGARKIEDGKISKEDSLKIIAKITEEMLIDEKPSTFEKMESSVLKKAKDRVRKIKDSEKEDEEKESTEDIEKEAEEKVTGPLTPEIIKPKDVEKGVKDASDKSDAESVEDIIKEMEEEVRSHFDDSKDHILKILTTKVKEFNELDDDKRKEKQGDFDYSLDSNGKLKEPTMKDLESIYKNFLQVAGLVVPYVHGKRKSLAFAATIEIVLFEIYAIKKTPDGDFTKENLETLVDNVKKETE